MDGNRFDRIAKRWAAQASRRTVLGGVLAAGLAPVVVRRATAAGESCEIEELTLWIDAFIPETVRSDTGRPITVKLFDGPFKGKTALPGPILNVSDCYLTDNRSFSSLSSASARMRSLITLNLKNGTIDTTPSTGIHISTGTWEVDCEDGSVDCHKVATVQGSFSNFRPSSDKRTFTIDVQAEASDPCITGAPDIDYMGTFKVELNRERNEATVSFAGKVEPFPAFEAYAQANDNVSSTKKLFTRAPEDGKTPWNIVGNASQIVSGAATITRSCSDGNRCCDGKCVNIDEDDANCGGCRTKCDLPKRCSSRRCQCPNQDCDCGVDPATCACNYTMSKKKKKGKKKKKKRCADGGNSRRLASGGRTNPRNGGPHGAL